MSIENYRVDGEPRALYYAEYRTAYTAVYEKLTVGKKVIPLDISVSFMGNNGLIPTSFDLRNADRQPVGEFITPGKSAHVTFTENCDIACGALFDRKARRTDHLYTVTAKQLEELDYFTYYLPLPNMPLHLRVVHAAQVQNPTARDIPHRARIALADLLNNHKVC